MAEGLKALIIAGVMGTVSQAGGRKNDKFYIFLAGGAYAGIAFITAWLKFTEELASNPLVKGSVKFFQFLFGLGS